MALNHSQTRQIARRYGRAVYELACEAGQQDIMGETLDALALATQQSAELARMISHPAISAADKSSVMDAILTAMKAPKLASQLMHTLINNSRLDIIAALAIAYRECLDEAGGVVRGTVTSASALSDTAMKTITDKLAAITKQTVVLNNETNEQLIGGLTVKIGSRLLDLSVAGRLERMRRSISQPTETSAG